ncbi:hypothetical protein R2R70_23240, partial [Cobetia sp. SIMBA_158]|uniref:hypothetical protein n=1 Tax=Cobetia sp. SIMBA_158 TaxID=3081617 RepID=UPI0039808BC2
KIKMMLFLYWGASICKQLFRKGANNLAYENSRTKGCFEVKKVFLSLFVLMTMLLLAACNSSDTKETAAEPAKGDSST